MLATVGNELVARRGHVGLEDDVGLGQLALDLVGNPGHRREGDGRVHAQHPLDLGRVDVEAGGQDHVGLAVDDGEVSVLVHGRDVAGVQPAVGFDRCCEWPRRCRSSRPSPAGRGTSARRALPVRARRWGRRCRRPASSCPGRRRRWCPACSGPTTGFALAAPASSVMPQTSWIGQPVRAVNSMRLGRRQRLSADPAAGQARQVGPVEVRDGRAGSSTRSERRPSGSPDAPRSRPTRRPASKRGTMTRVDPASIAALSTHDP